MDVLIDISNTVLETERIVLRAFRESDLDDLYAYASVDGVGKMAGWRHHASIDESKRILGMFIEEKSVFAITDRQSKKVIGSLGLHVSFANDLPEYADRKVKEIGYVLSKTHWGKGLIPEAVKAVVAYCFDILKLDAVTVSHFTTNLQSQKVIEKCGFSYLGEGKFYAKQLERFFDDKQYILLREAK